MAPKTVTSDEDDAWVHLPSKNDELIYKYYLQTCNKCGMKYDIRRHEHTMEECILHQVHDS